MERRLRALPRPPVDPEPGEPPFRMDRVDLVKLRNGMQTIEQLSHRELLFVLTTYQRYQAKEPPEFNTERDRELTRQAAIEVERRGLGDVLYAMDVVYRTGDPKHPKAHHGFRVLVEREKADSR